MATEGYNLLVITKENVPNAQSPPCIKSYRKSAPLSRSPVTNNSSPLRRVKQAAGKSIDGLLSKQRVLEEENLALQRRVEELQNENQGLRREYKQKLETQESASRNLEDQNNQLKMTVDLLRETIHNLDINEGKLRCLRKERNHLRKQNFESSQKIRRVEEYLQVSKTLVGNLQKDKQQLLDLVQKHHILLEDSQTSCAILGDRNIKIQEELVLAKEKSQQTEQKMEEVSRDVSIMEEELFVNMALSYKLARMNTEDYPVLTATIGDLYAEVRNSDIPKTEWSQFIISSLSPPTQTSNNTSPPSIKKTQSPPSSKKTRSPQAEKRPSCIPVGEKVAPVAGSDVMLMDSNTAKHPLSPKKTSQNPVQRKITRRELILNRLQKFSNKIAILSPIH